MTHKRIHSICTGLERLATAQSLCYSRSQWRKVLCETVEPGTPVGMEACTGAHHWGLSFLFRQLLQGLWGDLHVLDQRMTELDDQIAVMAQQDPIAKRLQQLRGVGPLIATALMPQ